MESQIKNENNENLDEQEEVLNLDADEVIGAIEAVLFSNGSSISISKLSDTLDIAEAEVEEALNKLERRYAKKTSGIALLRLEGAVQLCSKREYYKVLKKLVTLPRKQVLSDTVLETLSIVAYKQPVTRLEVEKIRGVSSDSQINKLIEYDLIKELGRLDAPGKPILFGTTEQFLRSFGVSSIDELPQASPDKIADFQAEARKEVEDIKI